MLLLAACTHDALTLDTGTPRKDPPRDTAVEELPGETAVEETAEEEPETWPKSCDEIYDPDTLPTFDLEFAEGVWDQLQGDCNNGSQKYRPVTLVYGEEAVAAAVRLKGNWSWDCGKLQFVVSFNEQDPDARWHGLRKLMFDAPWYDHTLLHERLSFPMFAARGLPYSCANNARVNVNGEYYGLYANLERIDHEYLERNFEDPSGNLYQGGSELKTNEDVGDIHDLTALQNATTIEQLDALIDLDEAVAEWSMEAMIPAMDNYWAGVEINYYLYDHPTRGFVYLPYDLDISYGDPAYTSGELIWPDALVSDPIVYEHTGWGKEVLFERVLADDAWCERFVEELRAAREVYDPDALAAQVEVWDAQIRPALEEDAHKPYTMEQHDAAVADLEEFVVARAAFVDAWLADGGHCPAEW